MCSKHHCKISETRSFASKTYPKFKKFIQNVHRCQNTSKNDKCLFSSLLRQVKYARGRLLGVTTLFGVLTRWGFCLTIAHSDMILRNSASSSAPFCICWAIFSANFRGLAPGAAITTKAAAAVPLTTGYVLFDRVSGVASYAHNRGR